MGTTRGGWAVLSEHQHTLIPQKRQSRAGSIPFKASRRPQKRKKIRRELDLQVGVTRFERATSSSRTTRSTKLSYTPDGLKSLLKKKWRVKDSNLRRHTPADLQSAPFGHLGNPPGEGGFYTASRSGARTREPEDGRRNGSETKEKPPTGIEPVTSRLQITRSAN